MAYWISPRPAPPWLQQLECPWAIEKQLSKLLGTPFGLNLDVQNIDEFLAEKIRKKLAYWSTVHLSLAGRATIVNSVHLSTLWYFFHIWGGSLKSVRDIRAQLRDFLWLGTTHRSRSRVRWTDCCTPRNVGGLNLVDPVEALHAMMAKWIFKAMSPGTTALQILLRYRMLLVRPQGRGNWPASPQWILLHKFRATRGSRAWDRIVHSWRRIVGKVVVSPPQNSDEVLSTNLWWSTFYIGGNFGFSQQRAAQLMHRDMCQIHDIWSGHTQTFLTWMEAQEKFGLMPHEQPQYEMLLARIPQHWILFLTRDRIYTSQHEYVGVFHNEHDELPMMVFETSTEYRPQLRGGQIRTGIPATTPSFMVGHQSHILRRRQPVDALEDELVDGWLERVRIISTPKCKMYVGVVRELHFDPGRFSFGTAGSLHSYTVKKGRTMLTKRSQLSRQIPDKWHGALPATYVPRWCELWHKNRPQKEAGFLWSVYHCAVAVHCWRAQMAPGISTFCTSCTAGLEESILHRFFQCEKTRHAWNFALTVMYTALEVPLIAGKWPSLTWQQCVLGSKLPRRLKAGSTMWSLFRGSVIWVSWLDRNAICFSQDDWNLPKLEVVLWEYFIDHIRVAWLKTQGLMELYPLRAGLYLSKFDKVWLQSSFFATRNGNQLTWSLRRPKVGQFV